jgi:hypothetical protein
MPILSSGGIHDVSSGVAICWPPNGQQTMCVPNAFNPCPHSHMKIPDVKGWIKPRWKHNKKKKCVMQNERINGLITNHSLAPLTKQKWMRALDAKELESSSKIDLRDVSWWMSIKNACRHGVLIIAKFSKEGCVSLTIGRIPSSVTHKHDWNKCGPLQPEKHTLAKWMYQKYET